VIEFARIIEAMLGDWETPFLYGVGTVAFVGSVIVGAVWAWRAIR
jgi:hypothetical protein